MPPRVVILATILAFVLWAAVIFAAAFNQIPFFPGGAALVQTGQFGDSFGVLSAAMASFAALYSFRAYQQAKSEAEQSKRDAEEARQRDITRDNESTFFRMLSSRRAIRDDVRYGDRTGLDAIRLIAVNFIFNIDIAESEKGEYIHEFMIMHEETLSSYFRYNYHILNFLHTRFKSESASYYMRLYRAELDGVEVLLITAQALAGRGGRGLDELVCHFKFYSTLGAQERIAIGLDKLVEANEAKRSK